MRIVICTTGASGAIYAERMLSVLAQLQRGELAAASGASALELHWVASANAPTVWRSELGHDMPRHFAECIRTWDRTDFAAPFASGSNPADAVIVVPCSMSTLARVAHGGGDDLITRACEVALKERRRLVLVARETPLSLVHLRNMVAVTEAGAIVQPAVPAFYGAITTLQEAVDTVVARALDLAGIRVELGPRWGKSSK